MHEENKTKNRAAAALALCFCVMALTSFLAVKASLNKISDSGAAIADNNASITQEQQAAAETPIIDSQKDTSATPPENSSPSDTPKSEEKYISPVSGNIQKKYSMTSLVYSQTLDQYMTHPGVDISADISSEVRAIADGTVSRVYNDDRYGVTVCIMHSDGITSIYSNLSEHGLTETGNEIKQGDIIGHIGSTALFESSEEHHLHFEMAKDNHCVDPGEFIKSLKQ